MGDAIGLRDVTSGNNSFNGVTGFTAGPGYDQATGWGSADITTLVNSWNIVVPTPTPSPTPTRAPTPSPTPTPVPKPSSPTLSPASINFGSVVIHQTSATASVSISNSTASPAHLTLSSISVSTQFSIFSPTTTCASGTSLAAGSRCTIGLRFAPTTTGRKTGTLSLTDNAANSPQTVSLSGQGLQ